MAIDDKHKEFVAYLEQTIKIIGKMGIRIEDFKKGYVKIKLPKEPNVNHIGTVYAGSLFPLLILRAVFSSLPPSITENTIRS